MTKKENLPMDLILRQEHDSSKRPVLGYVLYTQTANGEEPLLSRRNLKLKYKTIDKALEDIRQRSNEKEHRIKLFMGTDKWIAEGTIMLK